MTVKNSSNDGEIPVLFMLTEYAKIDQKVNILKNSFVAKLISFERWPIVNQDF